MSSYHGDSEPALSLIHSLNMGAFQNGATLKKMTISLLA